MVFSWLWWCKVDRSSRQICGMISITSQKVLMFKMNKNMFLEKIHFKNAKKLSFEGFSLSFECFFLEEFWVFFLQFWVFFRMKREAFEHSRSKCVTLELLTIGKKEDLATSLLLIVVVCFIWVNGSQSRHEEYSNYLNSKLFEFDVWKYLKNYLGNLLTRLG